MTDGLSTAAAEPIARLVDLGGRTAIVTGAGQGLGLAIARRLAEAGAAVVVNDLDAERAQRAADSLPDAIAVAGDHALRADVERVVEAALEATGRIDILVNNAGIFPAAPFLEADEALWSTILDVNLVGPLLTSQIVARAMIAQGDGGAIVNVSSMAAVVNHDDSLVAYGASKAGVITATTMLAKALAQHQIRVNAILPGAMQTPGAAGAGGRSAESIPLGRRADPDEVARGALFLASGLASYVTGVSLLVDGGVAVL